MSFASITSMRARGVPVPWWTGQTTDTWREIPGSAMSLLTPTNVARKITDNSVGVLGPSARLNAWCGLSIDTRTSTVWAIANGGHGDYYGNDANKIHLLSAVPAWAEALAGSTGQVVRDQTQIVDATDRRYAHYTDGLPTSRHSYYGQQFIERHDRALSLGGSISPRGSAFENVESFDVVANAWDAYDPATEAPLYGYAVGGTNSGWFGSSLAWSVAKHPDTEVLYTCVAPYFRKFTPADPGPGGTWSVVSSMPMNNGAYGATAVDNSRNRLFWVRGNGSSSPWTCDLATGVWTERSFPSSAGQADFDALNAAASLGIVYVPAVDAFFLRGYASGSKVWRVDAGTFDVTVHSTTGGTSVPACLYLNDYEQGVYNRWLYVPALGGIVYFPRSEVNAWFLKLH